ncbi:MAG: alpha/beta hydrolase, partial [Bacteroidota bacterium]|nr:alpha/beta hydrolase [Bacteroidota bacterium]
LKILMKHIYCISGFGADERVFSKLDFGDNQVHYLSWLLPFSTENIEAYAKRMAEKILHPNPILFGLSFGGMMVLEISKLINTDKVIIISSIKSRTELPFWMRIAGKLKLDKIFPMRSFSLIEPLENYNLGIENEDERKLVNSYRKNVSQAYTNWAIHKILNWKNEWQPANLSHIHGRNDHIFPLKYIKADYIIKDGGHFMIMNRNKKVNEILSSFWL